MNLLCAVSIAKLNINSGMATLVDYDDAVKDITFASKFPSFRKLFSNMKLQHYISHVGVANGRTKKRC